MKSPATLPCEASDVDMVRNLICKPPQVDTFKQKLHIGIVFPIDFPI